jgi:hypothetical protein
MNARNASLALAFVFAAALAATALPSAAWAQEGALGPAKRYTDPMTLEFEGDLELSVLMEDEGLDDSDGKQLTFNLSPMIGLFVVKGFEIGAVPTLLLEYLWAGDDSMLTVAGGLGLVLRYVIDLRSIVFPFIGVRMAALGGQVKVKSGDYESDTDLTILNVGPELGLKVEVSHAIFTVYFRYLFSGTKEENNDDWDHLHTILLGVGFGLWI